MKHDIKTIGVLTSGGDAPGMNAAIRAVVRAGKYYNLNVFGIMKGYDGLLNENIIPLDARDVSECLNRGGTFLQTARSIEFNTPEGVKKGIEIARKHGIDGLVVIGGDGSFRGVRDLCNFGMPAVGIPGTIDNDIAYTDFTIGFDTAVNTAISAVDKIRDTASSHERCNIIQVMGRNSGNIAFHVAIATGAEIVLVPEVPFDFDQDVAEPLIDCKRRHKRHYIIILAEGVGGIDEISSRIENEIGIETRSTNLGYVQRGGGPSSFDRILASRFGIKAVQLLIDGKANCLVGIKENKIFDIEINEALSIKPQSMAENFEINKILMV